MAEEEIVHVAQAGLREAATRRREQLPLAERFDDLRPPVGAERRVDRVPRIGYPVAQRDERATQAPFGREWTPVEPRLVAKPRDDVHALATSLDNFGMVLSNLGQREAALAATQEAVALLRQLVTRNPEVQPTLAVCLHNLGNRLSALGQREAALAAIEEAVARLRQLETRNPEVQFTLATSLDNLGMILSDLGKPETALAASEEAVALPGIEEVTALATDLEARLSEDPEVGREARRRRTASLSGTGRARIPQRDIACRRIPLGSAKVLAKPSVSVSSPSQPRSPGPRRGRRYYPLPSSGPSVVVAGLK